MTARTRWRALSFVPGRRRRAGGRYPRRRHGDPAFGFHATAFFVTDLCSNARARLPAGWTAGSIPAPPPPPPARARFLRTHTAAARAKGWVLFSLFSSCPHISYESRQNQDMCSRPCMTLFPWRSAKDICRVRRARSNSCFGTGPTFLPRRGIDIHRP